MSINRKINSFITNIDFKSLCRYLCFSTLIVIVLIPCDALAVYFVDISSMPASFKPSLNNFSFERPSAEISSFRQTAGSSGMFGIIAPSKVVNLVNAAGEALQALALKGIISLGDREAILWDKEAKKSVFLKKGDTFQKWSIEDIKEDSIVLSDGKNQTELKIEERAT